MANVSEPGLVSEVLGRLAYEFNRMQPYFKTELHTILAALFPIVIGAHASLTQPTSAGKRHKTQSDRAAGADAGDSDEEDEDEEDKFQRMEGFSRSDALWLPLYAGATLAGLYFLIKYLKDLDLLNKIMNYYFSSVGVFSVCKLLADTLQFLNTFALPKYYANGSGTWQVSQAKRKAINLQAKDVKPRHSPLPGMLGMLPLPKPAINLLWDVRQISQDKVTFKFYLHRVAAGRFHVSLLGIIGILLGLAATAYYNFVEKTWWLTNLLGFAFSYSALQLISPTTFDTGSLILAALFVYDIVMVFYTPMMVTVAKNLDVPIKLLIPRDADKDGVAQFSMLGLGDVVLPGMMIALALRFDLYLHYLRLQKTVKTGQGKDEVLEIVKAPYVAPGKHWANQFWTWSWSSRPGALPTIVQMGSFSKTYFWTSVIGYIIGMMTTLFVMITFQHAQPALLYLVPAVLISLWGMAFAKGDVKHMWEYTEAEEDEDETNKVEGENSVAEKKKSSGGSIFSNNKMERNEAKVKKAMDKLIEQGHTDDEDDGTEKSKEIVENLEKKLREDKNKDFVFFAISRYSPLKKGKVNWASTAKGEGDEHGRKRQRTA